MQSRMQHRKAVTLDTAVWPFSDTRVDKLENDVKGIRSDVADIKEMVQNPNGQTRNDDRDVDEYNTQDTSQDDSVRHVIEQDAQLQQLNKEIVNDKKEIDETAEKFKQEIHDLQLKHDATLHQMTTRIGEKETHANSLMEDIRTSTDVHQANSISAGVSSNASQYCVNLTR